MRKYRIRGFGEGKREEMVDGVGISKVGSLE